MSSCPCKNAQRRDASNTKSIGDSRDVQDIEKHGAGKERAGAGPRRGRETKGKEGGPGHGPLWDKGHGIRRVWGRGESGTKGCKGGGGGGTGAEPEEGFMPREADEGARVGGEQDGEEGAAREGGGGLAEFHEEMCKLLEVWLDRSREGGEVEEGGLFEKCSPLISRRADLVSVGERVRSMTPLDVQSGDEMGEEFLVLPVKQRHLNFGCSASSRVIR